MGDITEDIQDSMKGKYLTFDICEEVYGLEIRFVTEIIGIEAITTVPEMPDYIKGIINLRGKIIPVMDVRCRFGKTEREYDDRTCIVVVNHQNVTFGLIVDSVSEVISILQDNIEPLPNVSTINSQGFVKNIGKVNTSVILFLDCEKLLKNA